MGSQIKHLVAWGKATLLNGRSHSHTHSDGSNVWNVEELWKAAEGMPIEHLRVELFTDQLEGTCWTDGEDEEVTPSWVLRHTRRILEADLSHPIIIDKNGVVLDGVHRLCKAVLEGREVIAAQRLVAMPDPAYIVPDEDFPLFV